MLLYLEGLEPADRDATSDPSRIEGWWTRWADANIGMATGAAGREAFVYIPRRRFAAECCLGFDEAGGLCVPPATCRRRLGSPWLYGDGLAGGGEEG